MSDEKESFDKVLVLYDEECSMCRRLGQFGAKQAQANLQFMPFQKFIVTEEAKPFLPYIENVDTPKDLYTIVEGEIYEGVAAWEVLLDAHPYLKSFSWIAQKLGLSKQLAKTIRGSGHFLRRYCSKCNKK